MNNFWLTHSLLGGVLIGSATTLLLWMTGHVAGISGIIGRVVFANKINDEFIWRILFLLGLILGAKFYYSLTSAVPVPRENFPAWLLIISGLLVGYGASLGKGCTSGHGVCGLGRLSLRSLVATCIFLGTAVVTTFFVHHIIGLGGING